MRSSLNTSQINKVSFSQKIRDKMMADTINNQFNCFTGIIKMDHPGRIRWDFLIMILSLINGCTIPFDIAFQPLIFKTTWFITINYLIDLIFILDIFLNFRTTYKSEITGLIETDKKKIAQHYLFSVKFVIDFLSAFSVDIIIEMFEGNQ